MPDLVLANRSSYSRFDRCTYLSHIAMENLILHHSFAKHQHKLNFEYLALKQSQGNSSSRIEGTSKTFAETEFDVRFNIWSQAMQKNLDWKIKGFLELISIVLQTEVHPGGSSNEE